MEKRSNTVKAEEVVKILTSAKLIPVVVINQLSETEKVLNALKDGGLPVAEITFRTECAADAIKLATEKFPEVLTGAGTVINAAQCEKALECGAKFIVSPGLSEEVAKVCKANGVPYFPGCVTPTEIIKAIDLGITTIKFFPAQIYGGLKAIKALAAAFPSVRFIPTGGVDNSNLAEFISEKKIFACGGSWFFKDENVTKTVSQAVSIVKGGK